MKEGLLATMVRSRSSRIQRLGCYLSWIWQFRYLYLDLVKRDLKGRYRNSFLGYLWHLFFPLVQIVVYLAVFTSFFGERIENYWIYISSGIFGYSLIMSAMTAGCNVITSKSGMVTKSVFPREILAFAHVTISLITALISFAVLMTLAICAGCFTPYFVFIPVIMILEAIFSVGLVLLLSSITVYYRDVAQIMSALSMCMFFATPIMYRGDMLSPTIQTIFMINPATYYVNCIHDAFYYGVFPSFLSLLMCLLLSGMMFVIGFSIFKKLERRFAERL